MKWSNEETIILENNYESMSDEELQELLPNRTVSSISCKRKDMGLIRPQFKKYSYKDVIDAFSKRSEYILLSSEDEFINCNSKMRYICKKHKDKDEQSITLNHITSNRGCYYCGLESTASKRMIDFDKEYDKQLCESNNFEYIDTIRENGKITIAFLCNNHRELGEQHMPKTNMERDIKGCKYCAGKELPEWYVLKKAKEVNPYIDLLEPYKNLTTRMNCFCTKHNCNTRKTMQEILKGQGCYHCGIEKLSELSYLSLDEFQKRVNEKNKNVIVLEYNGMNQDAKFKCKLCGHEWYSNANSMTTNGKQCPKCMNYYNGERKISIFLDSLGIEYEEQFRFKKCRDKRPLPFDFYLYNYNVCIEYDGVQHFKQRNGWTKLEKIKKHDMIKNDFCKRNNIDLIRIPYWEFDDLEYFLFDNLVKLGIIEEIKITA